MPTQLISVCLIIGQFSTVFARKIGAEPSGFPIHFDAPPLEDTNLAIFSILLIATLIQLGLSATSLFRTGKHHISALASSIALLFLVVSYALSLTFIVAQWTNDDRGQPGFSTSNYVAIDVAAGLFSNWVDPLVCGAVFLVVRNRYRTYHAPKSGDMPRSKPPILLLPFTIGFSLLATLLFVISIAANAIVGNYLKNLYTKPASHSLSHETSTSLFYAYTAFYTLMVILIVAFAITVKMSKAVQADKITTLTLFTIMPALSLRALSRIIFDIVQARLPLSTTHIFTAADAYGIDLASTILFGGFHLVITNMLVYFLLNPRLWERMEMLQPQYGAYSAAGTQQHYQGGVQPPAQFPGQWGFTSQPQLAFPQGYPGYAPQGMIYYPHAQPQASPPVGDEKSIGRAPHSLPAQMSPQTS